MELLVVISMNDNIRRPRPAQLRSSEQRRVPQGTGRPYGGSASRRAGRADTRPLEPYPGYTPEGPTRRNVPQRRKRSKTLPVLLLLLIVAAAGVAGYFLLSGGQGTDVAALQLRENTNRYRISCYSVQEAIVDIYRSLNNLSRAFTGSDQIHFLPVPENSITFVDNDINFDYIEKQHASTMGRVIIPSLKTNGPLAPDSTYDTLYYGFGIVPFMSDMSEEGMAVILGHRTLTKDAGVLYMDEMKAGDPFYIDDYSIGKRYIYTTLRNDNVTEEEYFYRFPDKGHEPYPGQTCMLVVCDPFIYNDSTRRILVYGKVIDIVDVPEDYPFYQRYLGR